MNIPFQVARSSRQTPVVDHCVARHDGGYLVRLSDGRAAVSKAPLAKGTAAVLDAHGAVEAVR